MTGLDNRSTIRRLFWRNGGALPSDSIGLDAKWQAVTFLLLGFLASFVSIWLLGKFPTEGWIVLVFVLIVVVPTIVLFRVTAHQAIGGLGALVRNLTWWHFLWLLIFVSGLVLRIRQASEAETNPLDAAAAFRIALVAVTGLFLLVRLAMRYTDWLKSFFRGIVGALTIYAIVCLVSSLWSVYWEWTFYKACEYGVDIALLAAILATVGSTEAFKTLMDWTWLLYGLLLASCWVGVVLVPDQALSTKFEHGGQNMALIGVQLVGVFPDVTANKVGELAAVLAVVALARLLPRSGQRRNRTWYSVIFVASLVTMVLAQTRSAIGGFVVGVGLLILFSGRAIKGAALFIAGAFVLVLTGLGTLTLTYLQRGQTSQEMSSLTSRLQWWILALQKLKEVPLTGLGAYAAGRFAVLQQAGYSSTATLHSDWIETLVGTSIWGILPIMAALAIGWWVLTRKTGDPSLSFLERDLAVEALAVLGVLSVRTLFSTNLTWHPPLTFLAVLGYAEFLRRKAKDRRPLPSPQPSLP